MEFQSATSKIQEHLSNGETEKAIELLVEATKTVNEEQHENAVLLSGQFSQWKRQKMLGIIESDSELRRIEMSILTILKGEDIPSTPTLSTTSNNKKKNKNWLAYAGVGLGALALILVVWWHYSDTKVRPELNATPPTSTSTNVSPGTSTGSTSLPSSTAVINKVSILPLTEGMELEIGKRYYTDDEKYHLVFQDDGNLAVYETQGHQFKWGSIQAGKIQPFLVKKCLFREDGNLVLLDDKDELIWSTQTKDPKDKIGITDEGIPVVIDVNQNVIWSGK